MLIDKKMSVKRVGCLLDPAHQRTGKCNKQQQCDKERYKPKNGSSGSGDICVIDDIQNHGDCNTDTKNCCNHNANEERTNVSLCAIDAWAKKRSESCVQIFHHLLCHFLRDIINVTTKVAIL